MNKQEFLNELNKALLGLPENEREERLNFYSEMIEDRIEEGLSEEDAVSEIGSIDDIVEQIVADIPIIKIAKEKIKTKRQLKVWEIVLLALGSPVWISLLIAAFAVVLSLYVSLWSVIISLWAVFASFIGSAFGGSVSGVMFALNGNSISGIAMISAAIVCAGLGIFSFYGCKAVTKATLMLTKKLILGIKKCFVKKEEA